MKNSVSIVVVGNLNDYSDLHGAGFDFSDKTVVTTSIEVSQQCMLAGYDVINLWKYLDDETVEISEQATLRLTKEFRVSAEKLEFLNVSYFDTTKIYMRYFFKAVYHTIYVLERLFGEYNIKRIFIRTQKYASINVVFYEKSHVLDGVAQFIAEKKNVPVSHFDLRPPVIQQPQVLQFNPADFPFTGLDSGVSDEKPTILFILSPNFEWDFDLIQALRKSDQLNVLVIWRIEPIQTINIANEVASPLFFSDFSFDDEVVAGERQKIDYIREEFFQNSVRKGLLGEVLHNPHLAFQYEDLFERLKLYVADLKTFDRIFEFIQPDAVYFSNSWDMSVRCMIQRAQVLGAETFTTQHGGVADNAGYITRRLKVDNYLVWGRDNMEGLIAVGQEPETVRPVGSIQMDFWKQKVDSFFGLEHGSEHEEYTSFFDDSFKEIEQGRPFTVTYFTSAGGGFSGHSIHEFHHLETLHDITVMANRFPQIRFRIKPHVLFDYDEFWKQYAAEESIPINIEIIPKRDLLKACLETDIAVLVNTISNVAYEISIAGKPIVFLKEGCFKVECGLSTLERGGILCLDSVEEFEQFLKEYNSNSELKYELEKRRKQFLQHALEPFTDNVIKRIEGLFLKVDKRLASGRNRDIYSIIKWVEQIFINGVTAQFPDIDRPGDLPNGKELLAWLYLIISRRAYFYNNMDPAPIILRGLQQIPASYGVSAMEKLKHTMYVVARKYYLQLNLNENRFVRSILQK